MKRRPAMWAVLVSMMCVGMLAPVAALAAPAKKLLTCDESLKRDFKPDSLTTVTFVKAFKAGDTLQLTGGTGGGGMMLQGGPPAKAKIDLCLVKLRVGPGNPGPAGAPSTSEGIGMEIWLPGKAEWNNRIHNMGGGGWVGGDGASPSVINWPYAIGKANDEHAVTSMQDTGHTAGSGAFAMLPDGKPNRRLWEDFAVRGLHEQALKTKALTLAYYGRPQKYAYFDGGSTGGRQAHKLAQAYPADYDGIVGLYPAIYWTQWTIGTAYKTYVTIHDLGGKPMSEEQEDLVSNAAINACDFVGGQHLGYILDEATCRYDPTKDPNVLCTGDGGKNSTPACVTRVQANAVNAIWYGQTLDGSVPDPAVDNGYHAALSNKQVWFGPPRGTLLSGSRYVRNMMRSMPRRPGGGGFPGAPGGAAQVLAPSGFGGDMIALGLQDPTLATNFKNAKGDGKGLAARFSYQELASAVKQALAMDATFGYVNTGNPDLSKFKARGGKFIGWHGTTDEVIPVGGTLHFYDQLSRKLGGPAKVNSFYRMYIVPGAGHGAPQGTSNDDANPPAVQDEMYQALTAWVEKGIEPGRIEISSPKPGPSAATHPLCALPTKITYKSGDPRVAGSYACE